MAEPANSPLGSPLGGPSLEDEERAMRSGKGPMLAVMVVAVLAVVGGLGWYMTRGDEAAVYREFGKSVNALHNDQWLKFWECALQSGNAYERLRNNTDLKNALDQRAGRGGPRFGALVRDRCAPLRALALGGERKFTGRSGASRCELRVSRRIPV